MKPFLLPLLLLALPRAVCAARLGAITAPSRPVAAWSAPLGAVFNRASPTTIPTLAVILTRGTAPGGEDALAPLALCLEKLGWTPEGLAAATAQGARENVQWAFDMARSGFLDFLGDADKAVSRMEHEKLKTSSLGVDQVRARRRKARELAQDLAELRRRYAFYIPADAENLAILQRRASVLAARLDRGVIDKTAELAKALGVIPAELDAALESAGSVGKTDLPSDTGRMVAVPHLVAYMDSRAYEADAAGYFPLNLADTTVPLRTRVPLIARGVKPTLDGKAATIPAVLVPHHGRARAYLDVGRALEAEKAMVAAVGPLVASLPEKVRRDAKEPVRRLREATAPGRPESWPMPAKPAPVDKNAWRPGGSVNEQRLHDAVSALVGVLGGASLWAFFGVHWGWAAFWGAVMALVLSAALMTYRYDRDLGGD